MISGHYDGRDEFYSDRPGTEEFLPVEEMERASCSHSCSGLFSALKEVYLFGCNTLNPEALKRASPEIERSLIRSGHSPADAERLFRAMSLRHGESSRDRMRLIFKGVPEIYGFAAKAPIGPAAASMLRSYFRSGGGSEIGAGGANPRLRATFASSSMAVASGLTDADALASFRRDVCQFSDDRLSSAQKLDFVHRLMGRDMAEVRLFLDRIEKYVASVSPTERQMPEVAQAFGEIEGDQGARARYLEFARDADQPTVRARMIKLASRLGWLSPEDERAEIMRMVNDRLAGNAVSPADVDLVCVLNDQHGLDQELPRVHALQPGAGAVGQAAILACLGSTAARERVLLALTSRDDNEVQIAKAYVRRRPITNVDELRDVTSRIAHMNDSPAQVRALDTLADQNLADPESLEELAQLFSVAQSPQVQGAIAGILLHSDYQTIATPELAQSLRESRLTAPGHSDTIDILLRRLEGAASPRLPRPRPGRYSRRAGICKPEAGPANAAGSVSGDPVREPGYPPR